MQVPRACIACQLALYGLRVTQGQSRPTTPTMTTLQGDPTRPHLDDIRCARAVNFVQFCKQKGVKAMRIHMAALVELADQLENAQLNTRLLDELPTGLLE